MEQIALEYGYVGLFIISFIAATLIAAPSDVLAAIMPQLGYDPIRVFAVAATAGMLGNLINYYIGRYGYDFVLTRFFMNRDDDDQKQNTPDRWMKRAEQVYERYGVWTLLLSGTPFIGDPLTTVAGAFRVNLWVFFVLVFIGKVWKYALMLGGVEVVVRAVTG
ncbi:MAG: YqaA family protein [Chloroflexota bacterium]